MSEITEVRSILKRATLKGLTVAAAIAFIAPILLSIILKPEPTRLLLGFGLSYAQGGFLLYLRRYIKRS